MRNLDSRTVTITCPISLVSWIDKVRRERIIPTSRSQFITTILMMIKLQAEENRNAEEKRK